MPGGARLSDEGALHLQLQEGLRVTVCASPDQADVVYHCPLFVLDKPGDVALMTAALEANLHQVATRGGAIGLDLIAGALVFSWRLPLPQADDETLLIALENFCATAQLLRERLGAVTDEFSARESDELQQRARLAAAPAIDLDEDNAFTHAPPAPPPQLV